MVFYILLLTTFFSALSMGYVKFLILEVLVTDFYTATDKLWAIQVVGGILTLGPVLVYVFSGPIASAFRKRLVLFYMGLMTALVVAIGFFNAWWLSPWFYLFWIGVLLGVFNAAKMSCVPLEVFRSGRSAFLVNGAMTVVFLVGMLAGPPLATYFFNHSPQRAVYICLGLFLTAGLLGWQCRFPRESLRPFSVSLRSLLSDSALLLRRYSLYLVSSPLLWGVSGAISLAALAFAEKMNLGNNVQCTFLYIYLSIGIMGGNAIAPVLKNWRYVLSVLTVMGMALCTLFFPLFVQWAQPNLATEQMAENSYIFLGYGIILSFTGFFFGIVSNYIDSEYLQLVGDDGLEGTGAALQSAAISIFSFLVGSSFGCLLYKETLSAESQFIWLAVVVLLITIPVLILALRMRGFDEPLRRLLPSILRFCLSLRYRVRLGRLDYLPDEGGLLFLANHPAEIDPAILTVWLYSRFRPRPMVLETFYRLPVVGFFMRLVGALPIPDSDEGMSAFRQKRIFHAVQEIKETLQNGQCVLLYPAGMLIRDGITKIGGASAVHNILQDRKNFRVVLVKSVGLWGSSFSTALTGGLTPNLSSVLMAGLKTLWRNLLFFTPRREVNISFTNAPVDFPYHGIRLELNKWLEDWFNQEPEELKLVSRSFYRLDLPKVITTEEKAEQVDISGIPEPLRLQVMQKLATNHANIVLQPDTLLSDELGLDSLERGELLTWLGETFAAFDIEAVELKTVADVMKAAYSGGGSKKESFFPPPVKWSEDMEKRLTPLVPVGNNVPALFFKTCDRMKNAVALADDNSGVLSWKEFKIAVIVLAEFFRRKFPEEKYIGLLLPSSVGAALVSMALLVAGKVPVMINWTLGEKNLAHVEAVSAIQTVLSSEKFLDKLETLALGNLENKLLLLEDIRAGIGVYAKLKALVLSLGSAQLLERYFSLQKLNSAAECVLLFTSGSETVPKGVPLSHGNILANIEASLSVFVPGNTGILYGFLPPFHSFGFTITTILPLVSGLKTVYHPNPTEYRKLAAGIRRYGVTVLCGTPTFFSGILKTANSEQLRTVRTMIAGAEKAPEELFQKLAELNPSAEMLEGYGITECSPVVCLNPPKTARLGVGAPLPGVSLLIIDPDSGLELAEKERGLVLVRGENVFQAYLGVDMPNPFLEKKGFSWYNTGDLGFIQNGSLVLAGRLKRFVKKGGEMISLPALEQSLAEKWPPLEEGPAVAVEALEDTDGTVRIVLFTGLDLELEAANTQLRNAGFGNVARLNEVYKLAQIPLLGSGKTDYRSLKELLRTCSKNRL